MRVLQVTTSNERRGAEVFAGQLGEALEALGHDVATVALRGGVASPLPFAALGSGRTDPRTYLRLVRLARRHDVVVAHGGSTLAPVAAVATVEGVPFVYRNIGDPSYWGAVRAARWRIGAPLRRAAAVVALYEEAGAYLTEHYGLDATRVWVGGNAVDDSRFVRADARTRATARAAFGVPVDEPVLGYLGALSPEKRPELAVDAWEELGTGVLLVGGDGPQRAQLEDRARRSAGRLALLGTIEDPAGFLAALDVLVLPSRTEGIPGVLIEAALVGTPVVAADVGGIAEVVRATACGRIAADPRASAFAGTIAQVLADPAAHIADPHVVTQRYGLDAVAAVWDRVLRTAVGEHRADVVARRSDPSLPASTEADREPERRD